MNQKISQINPIAPVKINAHCHPNFSAINGTVSGAMIAPIFDPELKIPVARALSFLGNHSAVALIAAGSVTNGIGIVTKSQLLVDYLLSSQLTTTSNVSYKLFLKLIHV